MMAKHSNAKDEVIPKLRELKGTYFRKDKSKPWAGSIVYKGKTYREYFYTEQEAHQWYLEKSKELYGFDRFNPENDLRELRAEQRSYNNG